MHNNTNTSAIRQRSKFKEKPEEYSDMPKRTQLHYYHELDEWQQDNHYIKSGYVKETKSYKKSLLSLGYLHNETVNVYSHLIPGSMIILAILYYCENYLPVPETYFGWEKVSLLLFGIAATVCLLSSSFFHCLKSHSLEVCKFGNQLDYFGIVILITCSLISIMMFTFNDNPFWKYTYITLFLLLGSVCAYLTLNPKFSTNAYRPIRSAMFIVFGLSGGLPIITASSVYGVSEAARRSGLKYVILEGFFYILGAVLYAARFPERLFHTEDTHDLTNRPISGKFDIFGNSHQIFHVLVVVAAYNHWLALVDSYKYLHKLI